MKVIEYLKAYGLEALQQEFYIKAKVYDVGLIVLNYDQIYSPKAHPIVMECRGLILDKNFNVVSRSFDRFFNLGEQPETQAHIDMSKARVFEKVDGSLIKIYHWGGKWNISTRGTAFAESEVNGFDTTFEDIVVKALGYEDMAHFRVMAQLYLTQEFTYIFEVTSLENRVVKHYSGYTLHYLGARNNSTGEYGTYQEERDAMYFGARIIDQYSFESIEECVEVTKHLKDLDEGYVLYQDGKPVCKIKSPVYVAVHNIRGEGLNPKRIAQVVLSGEADEYLKYFPEDESFFKPYFAALTLLQESLTAAYSRTYNVEDQKDFALLVKDLPYSAVLFQCKKAKTLPHKVFEEQSEAHKIRMLEAFLEEST